MLQKFGNRDQVFFLKCVSKLLKYQINYEPFDIDRITFFKCFGKKKSDQERNVLNMFDKTNLPTIKLKIVE